MQEPFDALEQYVMPLVKKGRARVITRDTPDVAPSRTFIEAYPHDSERHTHCEWMWLLSGTAHMKVDGRVYQLAPGELCFLPPQMPHSDVFNRETSAYQSLWFSYWPDVFCAQLVSYQPFGRYEFLKGSTAASSPAITAVLLALQQELAQQEPFASESIQGLIMHLTALLLRAMEKQHVVDSMALTSSVGHVSARALHFLNENYSQPLTLDDVARSLYLSPNYLATLFKQETGHTIFDTLARIRIDHATNLLLQSQMPLHQVAQAVGYNSLDRFSRTFRKLKGSSPSRYIKRPQ